MSSKDIKNLEGVYKQVYITEAEDPNTPPAPSANVSRQKPLSFAATAKPSAPKQAEDDPDAILKKAKQIAPKGFIAPRGTRLGSPEAWKNATPGKYGSEDLIQYNGMEALERAVISTYRQRKSKNGLMIYGEPGEGKSSKIKAFAKEVAKEKGKIFVDWQQIHFNRENIPDSVSLDAPTKIEILKNPEKYFVLVTEYCNGRSPDDYRGIPADVLNDTVPYYSTKQPLWIYFVTLPHADGIIFFDEVNHDTGSIQNELYKVFLERTFGDTRICENFAIYAAGNLAMEEPLKEPLRNRMRQGVIVMKPGDWLKWAEEENINHYIVDFVKSNPAINFRSKPASENAAFPTPRTITMFSQAFDDILKEHENSTQWQKDYKGADFPAVVSDRAAEYCGPTWAGKFVAYMRDIAGVDFSQIKHETLPEATTQELWPILSYVQQEINAVHAQWSEDTDNGKKPRSFMNFPDDPNKLQEADVITGIAKIANHLLPNWCRQLFNRLKHQVTYTDPATGRRIPDENFFTKLIVFLINGNYDNAVKNEFNKPGGTYAQLQEYLADMPKHIPAADLEGGSGVVAPGAKAGVSKKK